MMLHLERLQFDMCLNLQVYAVNCAVVLFMYLYLQKHPKL